MIIAGTGHRPNKLGGHSNEVYSRLVDLAIAALKKFQPETVISGMALGWDQALAEAAIALDIPLFATIPFQGQESRWPAKSQRRYQNILAQADSVHLVSAGPYSAEKFQLRNEFMVDHADQVLAVWNGSNSGTKNCIDYAQQIDKPVTNLWKSWIKYR